MQKIVVDSLAAQYAEYSPYPQCSGTFQGAPPSKLHDYITIKELPIKGAYTNNMTAINGNFTTLHNLNVQLSKQIEETKQQNITLQQKVNALNDEISKQKIQTVEMKSSIDNLSDKIKKIISYIPQFVRESSENFIRLLTGIKTNAIDNVQLNEIKVIEN